MTDTPPLAQRIFGLPGFGFCLAVAIFACFPDVLLGHATFYYRDYGVLGFPVVDLVSATLRSGELPLWNPYSNCGVPLFAQWGTLCSYPFSALFIFLPLPWSLSLFCFAHLWLGGLGMYLLARRWTGNNVGSAVSGFGYAFSGVMFASFIWPNYFVALGWMPFVVLTAERAWREGGRWIPVAALVAAMQLGSGVPEIILLTWLIVGVLALCDIAETPGSALSIFGRTVGVIALAAGLMAVQLLPFFDLLSQSQREAGAVLTSKWSLPVWASANLIAPLLNCFETQDGHFFPYGQAFLSSVYLGLPVVILAVVGVLKFPAARTWALLLLALISVVLAFGDNTPLFPLIRKFVPVAAIARYPVKFMFLPAFVFPLLAGLAIRALHIERRVVTRPLAYTTLLFVLGVGVLVWGAHEHWFPDMSSWPENFRSNTQMSWKDAAINAGFRCGIAIAVIAALVSTTRAAFAGAAAALLACALIVVDGRMHAPNQNPTLPTEEFAGRAWDDQVGEAPALGAGRLFITPQAEEILLDASSTNQVRLWRAMRAAEWSNLNLLDRIPKVNGSATLQLAHESRLEKRLYSKSNTPPETLLNFLAATFTSSPESPARWSARSGAMPFMTAGQEVKFASEPAVMGLLFSNRVDLARTVILPENARATVTATNAAEARVSSLRVRPHSVEADVQASADSLCVIAQSFSPNWKAFVDGKEVSLHRANVAFQAIAVPAGQHHIRLQYIERFLKLGAIISGCSLLVSVLLLIVAFRRSEG